MNTVFPTTLSPVSQVCCSFSGSCSTVVFVQSRKLLIEPIMFWLPHRLRSPSRLSKSNLRQETIKEPISFLPLSLFSPHIYIFSLFRFAGFLSIFFFKCTDVLYIWERGTLLLSHLWPWQIYPVWKGLNNYSNTSLRPPSSSLKRPPPPDLPNQEVCTGSSCPLHPLGRPWPGASWEWSNVWPSTCGGGDFTVIRITISFAELLPI